MKNNILGGIYGKKYGDASVMTEADVESWFLTAARKNRMLGSDAEAKIADPLEPGGSQIPTAGRFPGVQRLLLGDHQLKGNCDG